MHLNLKHLRESRHMTQERVASLVPMRVGSYRKYESNSVSLLNKNLLQRFCIVLDCRIDELLIVDRH